MQENVHDSIENYVSRSYTKFPLIMLVNKREKLGRDFQKLKKAVLKCKYTFNDQKKYNIVVRIGRPANMFNNIQGDFSKIFKKINSCGNRK